MAKGRKYGPIHLERLLGSHPYGPAQGTSTDCAEFIEEEVWSATDGSVDGCEETIHAIRSIRDEPTPGRKRWATSEEANLGGLSLAFQDRGNSSSRIVHRAQDYMGTSHHMASSAPVNVPVYPKFLRVDLPESFQDYNECDDDMEWVPPHEYLAREYAHSRKSAATSVFEGVGRTLKGRDLSRVRNAVWTQTGFDG